MISLRKPGNLILVYWKDTLQACLHATTIPLQYRIWAVLNGFNPEAAWFKRISKSNKKDFLTDHTYYKNTPYNDPKYMYMVGKDHFRETLKDYFECLPKYYAEIKNNTIEKKDAWNESNGNIGASDIINLLEKEKVLAFKRISGRSGAGFIVGRCQSIDSFTFNDAPYNRQEAEQYIATLDGYIVSEFVQQCSQYETIWSKTTHTLRVQTCNVMNGKAEVVFAFLRFGSSKALHFVSHINAPGIYTAMIDIETGKTKTVLTPDEQGRVIHVTEHPDTGVNLVCSVPHWNLVVSKCIEMHDKILPNLNWLGWDIMITDDGFRILEINTLSGLLGVEAVEPILASDRLKPLFNKLIHQNRNHS